MTLGFQETKLLKTMLKGKGFGEVRVTVLVRMDVVKTITTT